MIFRQACLFYWDTPQATASAQMEFLWRNSEAEKIAFHDVLAARASLSSVLIEEACQVRVRGVALKGTKVHVQ